MSDQRTGWSWFERDNVQIETSSATAELPDIARELRVAYARCFSGPAGEKVLKHLKSITLNRSFGPDASADLLRHTEGQRQLVTYIKSQYENGRKGQ
ncbi:MAG: hypothetical protein COB59_03305 [Rhodospirillaceae bacterium]|nr:MAG: hypothetical protein COB59_03305 [Rhodospirillaceae bacterium]